MPLLENVASSDRRDGNGNRENVLNSAFEFGCHAMLLMIPEPLQKRICHRERSEEPLTSSRHECARQAF
jgi:hypothetical protein